MIAQSLLFISVIAMGGTLDDLPKNPLGYSQLTANQLAKIIDQKDFPLVNVHVPYNGEIPGTDANIAYYDLERIVQLFPDRKSTIVIYCRSGAMSYKTAVGLVKMGYEKVIDLTGGYNSWRSLGQPLSYQ